MTAALVASVVLLWIVVIVLAGVVFALTRQIGVLYERVAPAGALMTGRGVVVGEEAPVVRAERLDGATELVGAPSPDSRSTLVFFLSTTCPVCKTLLPALASMAAAEASHLRIVLASDGDRAEHAGFARREKLDAFAYVLSTQLGVTWQIAKLPYAVLLDPAGVVRAHGIVNSREHLESLVEARDRGVASIQEFARRHAAHEHDSEAGAASLRARDSAPAGGNSHAPVGGNSHAPVGGTSHAPVGGNSHAPVGGTSHAPVGGNSHAPVGAKVA